MIEVNGVRIGVHENHFVMEFVTDEAKALYQSNKEYFRKGFEDICSIANADIKKPYHKPSKALIRHRVVK